MSGILSRLASCVPGREKPYCGGPSVRIGVLGGGQLGRMMIQDAIDLDARVEVMDPSADAPCAHLTQRFVQGNLLDAKAVEAFGTGLDCITIEIEGVSVPGLEALERKGVRVVPKPAHIALIQDKGLQKQFFQKHNIATAPFALQMANGDRSALGYPVVQKLRRGGYDGKGVAVLKDASSQHFQGKDAHCVLEQKIDIEKELSVVVCRRSQYDTKCYEPTECVFDPRGNVVQLIVSPASITPEQKATCNALAKQVVDAMDYIGILAVEMFLEKGTGKIMVNELAPRAHNSGHHTIEQCATSQFGQLLRVVLDLPLGDVSPTRAKAAAMVNILGSPTVAKGSKPLYRGLREALGKPGVYPHLYGKSTVSPFRKMGHITMVGDDRDEVVELAKEVLASVACEAAP